MMRAAWHGSFEALLSRFAAEANMGRPGFKCNDQISAAIYVPGRSTSHSDAGFGATKEACSGLCDDTAAYVPFLFGKVICTRVA